MKLNRKITTTSFAVAAIFAAGVFWFNYGRMPGYEDLAPRNLLRIRQAIRRQTSEPIVRIISEGRGVVRVMTGRRGTNGLDGGGIEYQLNETSNGWEIVSHSGWVSTAEPRPGVGAFYLHFNALDPAPLMPRVALKPKCVPGVYLDMRRFLGISAALSGVLCVALALVLLLSYPFKQDSFKPGLALTPHLHVGVLDGAICVYSHLAFGGGTTSISRGDQVVDPVQERVLGFPGGYYVAFRSPSETVWSLKVPLSYPVIASAALPLIWLYLFRFGRAPNKPASGNGAMTFLFDAERPCRSVPEQGRCLRASSL